MTTFEITIIVLLAAIVVLLIVLLRTAIEGFHGVWQNQSYNYNELRKIVVGISDEVGQINARIDGFIPWAKHLRQKADNLENAWACDITSIIGSLRRLENCLTQDINWGELTDGQKSEILYRLTHPVVESPFKPPFNPTCETTNKED